MQNYSNRAYMHGYYNTFVYMHNLCTVIITLLYICTILQALIWKIFWLKCVKLTTFLYFTQFCNLYVVALIVTNNIVKYFVPPYFHIKKIVNIN